ncbi:D-2-hydroxyglutarate dehydrogenase, mitochondrial-like isoform X1 [Rhododendron vialii]|uniref:D-2-hydroxyglutarate dehydrogenase, mitochondrial-like isoform X1 n=1 Tax=Rhododendron vialii TaxID=182163 RepID=UPI0026601D93|nr:D-2-hydroxyglutarate dehydrogenase, mitochondrial-like isoform X1 [Rhododendron vialii]XP_058191507.1 D-2-hydroxyglutarate dehydrogenase, mitochondrial-like isoform X1 [Rhododendron vialii]
MSPKDPNFRAAREKEEDKSGTVWAKEGIQVLQKPSHFFSSPLIPVPTLHSPHQGGSDAAHSRTPPAPTSTPRPADDRSTRQSTPPLADDRPTPTVVPLGVPEALMKAGAVYKYDLSLPIEKMYDLVDEMRMRLGPAAKVVGYGHLGDGNLHLNISLLEYDDIVLGQVEPFVYEWTSKHRGSISAEHGLGLMKANKIHYSKSTESVHLMVSIKKLLVPNGILNPYKVLPSSLTS